MSRKLVCEVCGRPRSNDVFRYSHHGTQMAEIETGEMKRCWSCKRQGCDHCLVVVGETADDHFIDVFSCRDCLSKLS
jgi:hypothetical protein